jgi:hypothetical protein
MCRLESVSTAAPPLAAVNDYLEAFPESGKQKTAAFVFKSRRPLTDFHSSMKNRCHFCGFFLFAAWQCCSI